MPGALGQDAADALLAEDQHAIQALAGQRAGPVDITSGDLAFLNSGELQLNSSLRQVAQAAGAGYADTYTPSEGHDACSAPASRWIEPLIPDSPAAPMHPNAVGEQGMAVAVERAIEAGA